ncbi:helix-turn-helix domain-containing protein [Streptomyces sp. NPDC020817]|uniref:helix-turn-helix domain-containing protein n=1 Tax=Streptomyces sp. NPDC020817 TaxID=3365095 RepID=UPI0037AEB9E1
MPAGLSPALRALTRDACPHGTWEVVRGRPHPRLRPGVRGYRGYRMDLGYGRRRLEVPDACVSLVFNLADPVWVTRAGAAEPLRRAWGELLRSGGSLPVEELAVRAGRGKRRLEYLFREQIGLTPKTAARVLRFQRTLWLVDHGGRPLADVAVACGFSDQAHMNREFKAMSGRTPRRFRSERGAALPGGPAGVDRVAGQVTSIVLPDRFSRS